MGGLGAELIAMGWVRSGIFPVMDPFKTQKKWVCMGLVQGREIWKYICRTPTGHLFGIFHPLPVLKADGYQIKAGRRRGGFFSCFGLVWVGANTIPGSRKGGGGLKN